MAAAWISGYGSERGREVLAMSINGLKLVGLGTTAVVAALAFTGGCSSSSDSARTGSGGATATAGGGALNGAGTGTVAGGATSAGGATPAGGATAGGATGTAGASSGTDVCGLPTTTAPNPLLYNGATTAPNCGSSVAMPHVGYWFNYGDATAGAMETGKGTFGGCGGPTDCAYHVTGSGYTDYGAGIGFDLNDNTASPAVAQPFDATPYMGLQFFAKGTITGTRGPKYANMAQEIHVKFVTATDRSGDDYGGYCTIGADWMKCSLAFAAATRDGFSSTPDPTTDMFDANMLEKIQLEFSKFSQPADAGTLTPVDFDVWVDDVSFF
jgi:hypothetical protein